MQPRLFGLPVYNGKARRDQVEHLLDEDELRKVERRRKPTKVFWENMADLFGEWVKQEWIHRCLEVMRCVPGVLHERQDLPCEHRRRGRGVEVFAVARHAGRARALSAKRRPASVIRATPFKT
jgi:protein gp37